MNNSHNAPSRENLRAKPSKLVAIAISIVFTFLVPNIGIANAEIGKSGLELPRFASIKAKRVNMRVGPGSDYQILWMYIKQGLPVEIIQEYGNWRKVRDPQGNEGWMLHSLLSTKRTAIVTPWNRGNNDQMISMHNAPDGSAHLKAILEPGVVAKVSYCDNQWCKLSATDAHGYVKQESLWGVYPDEAFDD